MSLDTVQFASESSPAQSDIGRLFEADVNSLIEQIVEPLVARRMREMQTMFASADEFLNDIRDVVFRPEE